MVWSSSKYSNRACRAGRWAPQHTKSEHCIDVFSKTLDQIREHIPTNVPRRLYDPYWGLWVMKEVLLQVLVQELNCSWTSLGKNWNSYSSKSLLRSGTRVTALLWIESRTVKAFHTLLKPEIWNSIMGVSSFRITTATTHFFKCSGHIFWWPLRSCLFIRFVRTLLWLISYWFYGFMSMAIVKNWKTNWTIQS